MEEKMEGFCRQVEEAASYVRSHLEIQPAIGLVLGTGLSGVGEAMEGAVALSYEQIPHFPVSTAPGHKGWLLCGTWAGKPLLALQGRFHLYEGYSSRQVSFPVRVMAALGIHTLILSNAAGGLNPQFQAGELMLITDHINLTGDNPLRGPNLEEWGPRFPDMTEPYSRRLQDLAVKTALAHKIQLNRGVYAGVLGPNLETAAETRFLRIIGADAVGMSSIMECITAVHAGLDVLGLSVITNVNLPDHYTPTAVAEIIAIAESAGPKLMLLLEKVLEQL